MILFINRVRRWEGMVKIDWSEGVGVIGRDFLVEQVPV